MVYDIKNLFTTRPEKTVQTQRKATVTEHKQSLFNFIEERRGVAFRNDPLDLNAAFSRLTDLLQKNTYASLEQNYRGRGSLLNIIA